MHVKIMMMSFIVIDSRSLFNKLLEAHVYQIYCLFLIDSYLEIFCIKFCSFSWLICSVAVYMSHVNVTQAAKRGLTAFSIAHTWQPVIALGIRHHPEIWCTYTPITVLIIWCNMKVIDCKCQKLWLAKLDYLKRLGM